MSIAKKKIYFVVGEPSGDLLGADLLSAFYRAGHMIEAVGIGGEMLEKKGLKSLFNIKDISVMGISGVIWRLPLIIYRLYQTVADIKRQNPDAVVLIDSPDFTHAVAKKIKKRNPEIPILNYVCPSFWAWRQSRAPAMSFYIDHVLAILPFEPELLENLGGPKATYIGHPLVGGIQKKTIVRKAKKKNQVHNLLLLPGSRYSEVKRLLPIMGETLDILLSRGNKISSSLLTLPNLAQYISEVTEGWPNKPEILVGDDKKQEAFSKADFAVAASGTITLELAINQIPFVATYILDPIAKFITPYINIWTASLPNLIVDYPFIKERYNEFAKPANIARSLERLLGNTLERKVQMQGFIKVKETLYQERNPGDIAVETILQFLKK